MVGELSGVGSLAVDVAVSVAVYFIGFIASICTRQEIEWSPVYGIFILLQIRNMD